MNKKIYALDKEELLELLKEYDEYIQEANDENRYADGWFPVCISEFYDNEYEEQSDSLLGYEPVSHMDIISQIDANGGFFNE